MDLRVPKARSMQLTHARHQATRFEAGSDIIMQVFHRRNGVQSVQLATNCWMPTMWRGHQTRRNSRERSPVGVATGMCAATVAAEVPSWAGISPACETLMLSPIRNTQNNPLQGRIRKVRVLKPHPGNPHRGLVSVYM